MQNPPINIRSLLREAVQHHRAQRRDEAEQAYRKILSIEPQHPDATQLLGVLVHETGRHEEAIKLISAAIQLAPNIAGWHSNLGSALRAADRLDEAIVAFRRAIELDPNSAAAHFNLANALTQNKQLDEAIIEYQRAAELAPRDAIVQRTLAEALYEQGETRAAIEASERASPGFPAGHPEQTRARLFDATLLPLIYESVDEIRLYRNRLTQKIRALSAEGMLVLVSGRVQTWPRLLATRFKRVMPDVIDRIRWLPRLSGDDFFALTALCDVMLDTFPFGGCTTTSEALAFGVPVVTLPSQLLPCRFTQAFYRMMEMTDCIASSPQHYIDLAVEIGTDSDRRNEIRKTILSRNDVLFDNTAGVRELEGFLMSVCDSH